jgi:hypothetical protein
MPAVPEWVEQLRTNRTTTQIDTNTWKILNSRTVLLMFIFF